MGSANTHWSLHIERFHTCHTFPQQSSSTPRKYMHLYYTASGSSSTCHQQQVRPQFSAIHPNKSVWLIQQMHNKPATHPPFLSLSLSPLYTPLMSINFMQLHIRVANPCHKFPSHQSESSVCINPKIIYHWMFFFRETVQEALNIAAYCIFNV